MFVEVNTADLVTIE